MSILTTEQIEGRYFGNSSGFLPASADENDRIEYATEIKDYKGEDQLCIWCTQLDSFGYRERDKKRILAEWIDFLRTNTKAFKALHFCTRVPQALFDASCCQERIVELRFKWGPYSDLSSLENLPQLRYLYLGSCPGVRDITSLGKLKSLVVLYVENMKRIEDYSPLTALSQLEQLIISGPTLGVTPIKDLEFLREMPNLLSIWIPNTTIRRKYTAEELADLRAALPKLHAIYGCIWKQTG